MRDRNGAPFGRVLTAMVTPFDSAGAVNYEQAAKASSGPHRLRHGGACCNRHHRRGPDAQHGRKATYVLNSSRGRQPKRRARYCRYNHIQHRREYRTVTRGGKARRARHPNDCPVLQQAAARLPLPPFCRYSRSYRHPRPSLQRAEPHRAQHDRRHHGAPQPRRQHRRR